MQILQRKCKWTIRFQFNNTKILYKLAFTYFICHLFICPNRIIRLHGFHSEDSKNSSAYTQKNQKRKEKYGLLPDLPCTIFHNTLFSTNANRYNRFLHTLTRKYFYARLYHPLPLYGYKPAIP